MMSFLIGILAGLFGGLLGIGGGFVMIPLMVGLLKDGQHRAHGTSLAAMVFVGIMGSVPYVVKGSVDLLASVLIASTAMITAHAGARGANALSEKRLRQSFGIFLLLVAGLMFVKPFLLSYSDYAVQGWGKVLVLLATGGLTGFLSGMMGVGGAVVMIPAMVLLAGIDQHSAQGSSLLAMIPAGIVGAWTHWRFGNIDRHLFKGLIPGVFLGATLGGVAAQHLDEGLLRTVFGLLVLWTAFGFLRTSGHKDFHGEA